MTTQAEGAERTWRAVLNDNLLRPVQAFRLVGRGEYDELGMLMIAVLALSFIVPLRRSCSSVGGSDLVGSASKAEGGRICRG